MDQTLTASVTLLVPLSAVARDCSGFRLFSLPEFILRGLGKTHPHESRQVGPVSPDLEI